MSENNALIEQLKEQEKVIKFIQQKYKENVGHEIDLPQSWQKFLCIKEEQAPIVDVDQLDKKYELEKTAESDTFLQALQKLQLPQKLSEIQSKKGGFKGTSTKQGQLKTNFNPTNQYHMIETINMSNFKFRKFSQAGFRELLDSIQDMRCLSNMILQNNGIDDFYVDEITRLFNQINITNIDLSNNDIGKKVGTQIGKLLKDQITHIEWIDLSRNNFSHDTQVLNVLIQGLKKQSNLRHFGLNVYPKNQDIGNFTISENVTKLLNQCPNINSLSLIDSHITSQSFVNIELALQSQKHRILALNLKYNFLNTKSIYTLSKGLKQNRTLVKLDISNNGLSPICGIYLINALIENITLVQFNLSKNNLNNDFAIALADCLKKNDVLQTVDISYNPIQRVGADALLKAITEVNDTLENLGKIEVNTEMGVINIQEIKKALSINQLGSELKSKLMMENRNNQDQDPKPLQQKIGQKGAEKLEDMENNQSRQILMQNANTEYEILKPIIFTNEYIAHQNNFRLWNIN